MPRKPGSSSITVGTDDVRHLEEFSKMNGGADKWWLAKLCLRFGIEHGDEVMQKNGSEVAQRIREYLIREGLRASDE